MRKSKARLVMEIVGPTDDVEQVIQTVVSAVRHFDSVVFSYPEPCRIESIRRNRKPKGEKPERKARKANSQQPDLTPTEVILPA